MEHEDGSLELQPHHVKEDSAWSHANRSWLANNADWPSDGAGWASSSWNSTGWEGVSVERSETRSRTDWKSRDLVESNLTTREDDPSEKAETKPDVTCHSHPAKDNQAKQNVDSYWRSDWYLSDTFGKCGKSETESAMLWLSGNDWWKSSSHWASVEAPVSTTSDSPDTPSASAWASGPWSSWSYAGWGKDTWRGSDKEKPCKEMLATDAYNWRGSAFSWQDSGESWNNSISWKDNWETKSPSSIDALDAQQMRTTAEIVQITTNSGATETDKSTQEMPIADASDWRDSKNTWQDSWNESANNWQKSWNSWQDSSVAWKDAMSRNASADAHVSTKPDTQPLAAPSLTKRSIGRKVFVSGLNHDTNPQTLGEYCLTVGEVRFATVFTDPETGQSNGTGKIDFASEEAAQRAISELSGTWLDGSQIGVQPLSDVQGQRENDGRQVFVGGLNYDVGEEQLWAFVAPLGNASYIKIFVDRETGRSRGCGKIEFESQEMAERAINELNGKELNGRRVTVEPMGQDSGRRAPRRDLSTKVLFSGLSAHTTPQSLGEFCNKWIGGVLFATVYKNDNGPLPNGTGKVDFESGELAKRAVEELKGWWLDNCQISTRCMTEADSSSGPKRENDGRQVFFGGLSYDVSDDDLRAFASAVGNALVARVLVDRETGRSRGCGRVEFETPEQAQRAIAELNGKSFNGGRQVTVEPMGLDTSLRAVPRPKASNSIDGRQVFFAGLSVETDVHALRSLCESVGSVTSVLVFTDRETGKPKGTGKVQFESVEFAQRAVEELDKRVIDGLVLTARLMSQEPGPRQVSRQPTSGSPKPPPVDGRQVFCGGLGQDVDSDALRDFCAAAGKVTYSTIFIDRETGRSKGAGKVEFETVHMAQYAIDHLDGQMLEGRPVTVRLMNQEPRVRSADVPKGPPAIDGRQVFVGGIGPEMEVGTLRELFSDIGGITYASILTDRESGQSKGSGKVEFETVQLAQKAVEAWEGHTFEGRDIVVRIMDSPANRQPRQPRQEDIDPECKLFIGSLPAEISDDKLKDVLSQAGAVVSASVFATSMGFAGRAVMASADEAQRAIDVLHGTFLMEKRIMVRLDAPPSERAPKPNLDSMIFVGGMSFNTSVEDLQNHFARIGDILHASLFIDKVSGKPRGSGKIEFLSPLLAKRAVEEMDESELDGRRLHVKLMEARQPGDGPPGLDPPQKRADGRTVFIGGLSWDVSSDDLKVFASQLGEVSFATVFYDRETGKSRGSGKVQFVSAELAEQATSELNGRQLMGREVTVRIMEQR